MANPDRKVILDLSAVEEARGPQPNDYFVCLTPMEAALCAVGLADRLNVTICTDRECPECNMTRRLFWDIVGDIGAHWQKVVFAALTLVGTPIPDGPWEEVR